MMQRFNKTLIALAVANVLGGGTIAALAGNTKTGSKPSQDGQYASEVKSGSIRIKDDNEQAMAAKARVTASEAAQIATKSFSGKVTEAQLDEENGFLIWKVEVMDTQGQEAEVKIDAGDGQILALESGEDDEDHEGNRDDDCDERGG